MEYKNFFENQKEAQLRLASSVVLYDGEPVEVLAITDHKLDGILRAYVRPTGYTGAEYEAMSKPDLNSFPPGHSAVGPYLDEFMVKNPSCRIMRKHLSSPLFNKFRPFELGMCWNDKDVYYIERQPNRSVYQGLISQMMVIRKPSLSQMDGEHVPEKVDLFSHEMKRCIRGEHPSFQRCIQALLDTKYANNAAAFHRHFALVKGPVESMFLAYKNNIIGMLPHGDNTTLVLGADYKYCKEAVQDLHLFTTIK